MKFFCSLPHKTAFLVLRRDKESSFFALRGSTAVGLGRQAEDILFAAKEGTLFMEGVYSYVLNWNKKRS